MAPIQARNSHAFSRVARGLLLAASGVVRWMLIALAVSGCGFSAELGFVDGDDDPSPDAGPDAGPTDVPRMCSTTDPTLRLCIDFDDTADLATDGSRSALPVDAQNLVPMLRDAEGAVEINATSRIYIPETPVLDIREDLTVSMWIKPTVAITPIVTQWLYDNNTQYFASMRPDGAIRCGVGTRTLDTVPLVLDGRWHHIACTYEEDEMRVYVDGHVAKCVQFSDREIPTDGNDGFAIGANLSSMAGAPKFAEQFVGGIDNVQVFSRIVGSSELCAAAGGTVCNTACL